MQITELKKKINQIISDDNFQITDRSQIIFQGVLIEPEEFKTEISNLTISLAEELEAIQKGLKLFALDILIDEIESKKEILKAETEKATVFAEHYCSDEVCYYVADSFHVKKEMLEFKAKYSGKILELLYKIKDGQLSSKEISAYQKRIKYNLSQKELNIFFMALQKSEILNSTEDDLKKFLASTSQYYDSESNYIDSNLGTIRKDFSQLKSSHGGESYEKAANQLAERLMHIRKIILKLATDDGRGALSKA